MLGPCQFIKYVSLLQNTNYVHTKTLDFNFGCVVHVPILVEVVKIDNKRQNSHT